MQTELLIVFVKAPRAGQVKTRLARAIGADAANVAYRRLAETVLDSLRELPQVQLRFAPDDAANEIRPWLRADWNALEQGAGDLGARLERGFDEAFAGGAQRVVVIGSDCPDISVADVQDAWDALRRADVVLGPATDGGYWLLGLRAPQPALLQNMEWSTSTVLAETLARCKASRLRVRQLRELSDVDTIEDWRRFLARSPE